MTKPTQLLHNWVAKVLVGVQFRHFLSILIIPDCLIDLSDVLVVVLPGNAQIILGQVGMLAEDSIIA